MGELSVIEERIPPVRALTLVHNRRRVPFSRVDVRRWLRIGRQIFRAEKIDLLNYGEASPAWPDFLECGNLIGARLSLRTDCAAPPQGLARLRDAGLFDLFLCPADESSPLLDAWLAAACEAALPVRLQVQAPFAAGFDAETFAEHVAQPGVHVVHIAAFDPFTFKSGCHDAAESLAHANALAEALAGRGIEVNLFGFPLCQVNAANLERAQNTPQFFLDHQQYLRRPYELAAALYRRGPVSARIALTMIQSRYTLLRNPLEALLLPWLINHPWFYARVLAWHKLTRHRALLRCVPKPSDDPLHVYEPVPPAPPEPCARCALTRICDHAPPTFTRIFPGLTLRPREGEPVLSPFHFAANQPKFYDAIDAERLAVIEQRAALARKATDIVSNRPPDRRIAPMSYGVANGKFGQLDAAVEWHGVTNSEKLSSPLTTITPPCTVSVTFGGGVAEYIGFSFGRDCKLLCRMEATRHTLVLHVEESGHYVLLRDGTPVRPVEFEGLHYAPLRLANRLELRLSVWNIDQRIFSQSVDLWEDEHAAEAPQATPKYSVIIVNTRYARRLQAVLRCLAHQENFDLAKIEVIVCYVPGLDATDDLIDSARMTYPALRILRVPFSEQRITTKGFLINESLRLAAGEWIVLLDADALVAPNMFARVDEASRDASFIAADGRKMLTPEVTARILMGEIAPWRDWDALLEGPGELRLRESHGVPVGFFQCFRASCRDKVAYQEFDHFEGSDMHFGLQLREQFGAEKRLTGLPVLHLDHGGGQWYGTQKHL